MGVQVEGCVCERVRVGYHHQLCQIVFREFCICISIIRHLITFAKLVLHFHQPLDEQFPADSFKATAGASYDPRCSIQSLVGRRPKNLTWKAVFCLQ